MRSPKADKANASKAPQPKQRAFLIAVKQKREATRIYAVLACSPADAVTLVQDMATQGTVEMVGALSHRIARPLKLRADELRLI